MHALFALYEPNVELINSMFATIFRDFCRVIDEQWDLLVESIQTGSIPESVDVGHLKDALLVSSICVVFEKYSFDMLLIDILASESRTCNGAPQRSPQDAGAWMVDQNLARVAGCCRHLERTIPDGCTGGEFIMRLCR